MKRVDLFSVLWLGLAIALTFWLGARRADAKQQRRTVERATLAAGANLGTLPSGERAVVDANGVLVPVRRYTRIATTSTVADQIVLAVLEPERVIAMSDYGMRHSDQAHLYGARALVAGPPQLERLLADHVDLVITHHLGSQADLARTREAGIQVFNLGDMRGLQTLLPNIAAVATLTGHPERGVHYTSKLMRRLTAVAADVPTHARKQAVYVSTYANQLFGGARGTSYHDVMEHAGLVDAAAARYEGWVHYDPEQLIELDPELVVTNEGTGEALCRVGGLQSLRACREDGLIMLDNDLLSDPGPRMLEAAEALHDLVYGAAR